MQINWKPELKIVGGGWGGNGLVFPTKEEALEWGMDRIKTWSCTEACRARPTDMPITNRMKGINHDN